MQCSYFFPKCLNFVLQNIYFECTIKERTIIATVTQKRKCISDCTTIQKNYAANILQKKIHLWCRHSKECAGVRILKKLKKLS